MRKQIRVFLPCFVSLFCSITQTKVDQYYVSENQSVRGNTHKTIVNDLLSFIFSKTSTNKYVFLLIPASNTSVSNTCFKLDSYICLRRKFTNKFHSSGPFGERAQVGVINNFFIARLVFEKCFSLLRLNNKSFILMKHGLF